MLLVVFSFSTNHSMLIFNINKSQEVHLIHFDKDRNHFCLHYYTFLIYLSLLIFTLPINDDRMNSFLALHLCVRKVFIKNHLSNHKGGMINQGDFPY